MTKRSIELMSRKEFDRFQIEGKQPQLKAVTYNDGSKILYGSMAANGLVSSQELDLKRNESVKMAIERLKRIEVLPTNLGHIIAH